MKTDKQLLVENNNGIRYLLAHLCFGNRGVPEEGARSYEEQDRIVEEDIEHILQTGSLR